MIKPKRVGYSKPIEKDMDNSSNYYNSEAWKRLRDSYIKEHPVCEICLQYGHVTPTEHIHHKYRFQAEHTIEAKWNTFLNQNNLIALCKKCHYGCHKKMRNNKLNECYQLTEEEYKQAQLQYYDDYGE